MLCTHESYSEFSKRIHQHGVDGNIPLNGGIEITSVCNFRCIHCYIREDDVQTALNRQMTFEEYCYIVDQISDAGCLWLQITGGEPLLRKDFTELYLYTKKKGLLPILFTNGSLLTRELAGVFAQYPPFSIDITLYGASEATYEQVTGNGENFARVIRALEQIKKQRLPLQMKSALMQQNVADLDGMRALAEEFGCKLRYDPAINQNIAQTLKLEELRIPPEQVIELEIENQERNKEWQRLYRDHKISKDRREKLFWCGAGKGNFHIDAECNLSACIMVRTPSFSLRKGKFLDGYINLVGDTIEQKRTRQNACTQCEEQILCQQCPGHAMLEYNDREQRVEYFCQVAQLRKSQLIKP